jgi:hypothetical protein
MKPRSKSPEDIAEYLMRNRAHLVIGVLHVLARHGEFRGKVNLGFAAGARGRNDYATRPVQSASRLGLATYRVDGAAYVYCLTDLGEAVVKIIDGV